MLVKPGIRFFAFCLMFQPSYSFAQAPAVDFSIVRHIISTRCRICHTAIPQEDGLNAASQPPKGVKFDSIADIQKFAPRAYEQAVQARRMPPDNATHMTEEERATLGKWVEAGAPMTKSP